MQAEPEAPPVFEAKALAEFLLAPEAFAGHST